jgi:hypothetical protein
MRTIETDLVVTSDGRANVLHLPSDIRGGQYHVVLVIDDGPIADTTTKTRGRVLRLSSYPVGAKDLDMTFRRKGVGVRLDKWVF